MNPVRFLCRLSLLAAFVLVGTTPALAQVKDKTYESDAPTTGPNCDVAGYKSERQTLTPPFAIVDNTDTDAFVGGPLFMPADGDIINDVILELTWDHTWIGDIVLTLGYDPDCTGPAAEIATRVICRPRGLDLAGSAPCGPGAGGGPGAGVGCGSNVGSSATDSANQPATYYFSDEAVGPIAEGVCPSLTPAGCYRPTTGSEFAIFRGLAKGGCWRLRVADWVGGEVGTIVSWAVHVRNQRPVPVTAASWGQIKGVYR